MKTLLLVLSITFSAQVFAETYYCDTDYASKPDDFWEICQRRPKVWPFPNGKEDGGACKYHSDCKSGLCSDNQYNYTGMNCATPVGLHDSRYDYTTTYPPTK
jgi:hypothetical protein